MNLTTTYGNFQSNWNSIRDSKTKLSVAVVGDSIGKKYNASSIANSWVGKLTTELQSLKGDGGSGFRGMSDAYGQSFGAAVLGDQYEPEDRVVLTGTWVESNSTYPYMGPGWTMGATTTVGSSATFTVSGNMLKVYYLGVTSSGGVISFTIDGETLPGTVNVGSRTSTTPASSVIKSFAGVGTHTVTVTLESGGVNLFGVSGENNTGAVVNNFSRPGMSALQASTGGTLGTDWNGGANYKADLIIYALGVNDLKYSDAATGVGNHARKFMDRLRDFNVNAPVIFLFNHVGIFDVNSQNVLIQARLNEVAQSYNGAVVDMWAKYQNSYSVADSNGYWGSTLAIGPAGDDTVHPSDAGHNQTWLSLRALINP